MKYICGGIGGMSPVQIVGAVLGQMKLTKPASRQSRRAPPHRGLRARSVALAIQMRSN